MISRTTIDAWAPPLATAFGWVMAGVLVAVLVDRMDTRAHLLHKETILSGDQRDLRVYGEMEARLDRLDKTLTALQDQHLLITRGMLDLRPRPTEPEPASLAPTAIKVKTKPIAPKRRGRKKR